MVVADRYAGKRCRNSSNLSLRAFEERSFGVIGIAFLWKLSIFFLSSSLSMARSPFLRRAGTETTRNKKSAMGQHEKSVMASVRERLEKSVTRFLM